MNSICLNILFLLFSVLFMNVSKGEMPSQDFYVFKNVVVHFLVNSSMPQNPEVYHSKIREMFVEVNKIYLNRTGKTVGWSIAQPNRQPNFFFKNISVQLHYKDDTSGLAKIAGYVKKTNPSENVLQLVFVEALERSIQPYKGRIIRGLTI